MDRPPWPCSPPPAAPSRLISAAATGADEGIKPLVGHTNLHLLLRLGLFALPRSLLPPPPLLHGVPLRNAKTLALGS